MAYFVLFSIVVIVLALALMVGLFYWLPKKLGYPKLAKVLVIILGIFMLFIIIDTIWGDYFFTKNNARQLLMHHDIILQDDFTILKNESMFAPGDYYHIFELRITEKDKGRIVSGIKNAPNFEKDKADSLHRDVLFLYEGDSKELNYETESRFVREIFVASKKKGYAPMYHVITIDKGSNVIRFEDIDE